MTAQQCRTCGQIKDLSEFPPVVKTNIFCLDECKSCRHNKSQKRNREFIRANDILHTSVKRKACSHAKKMHSCAKVFCQKIKKEKLIKIICPVCGIVFGVTKSVYNGTFNYFGRPPRYCSKPCYYIALTKKWQQKQSPYAKRITELLQEHP
jgi:hypothetical protein